MNHLWCHVRPLSITTCITGGFRMGFTTSLTSPNKQPFDAEAPELRHRPWHLFFVSLLSKNSEHNPLNVWAYHFPRNMLLYFLDIRKKWAFTIFWDYWSASTIFSIPEYQWISLGFQRHKCLAEGLEGLAEGSGCQSRKGRRLWSNDVRHFDREAPRTARRLMGLHFILSETPGTCRGGKVDKRLKSKNKSNTPKRSVKGNVR